jgi:hypothetical protein
VGADDDVVLSMLPSSLWPSRLREWDVVKLPINDPSSFVYVGGASAPACSCVRDDCNDDDDDDDVDDDDDDDVDDDDDNDNDDNDNDDDKDNYDNSDNDDDHNDESRNQQCRGSLVALVKVLNRECWEDIDCSPSLSLLTFIATSSDC